MLHSFYDNTLKTKNEAQKVVLPEISGKETQLYKVGAKVSGNGFNFGEIIDLYKDNGFYYYVIEYKLKPKARKTYTTTLRQKDVKLI